MQTRAPPPWRCAALEGGTVGVLQPLKESWVLIGVGSWTLRSSSRATSDPRRIAIGRMVLLATDGLQGKTDGILKVGERLESGSKIPLCFGPRTGGHHRDRSFLQTPTSDLVRIPRPGDAAEAIASIARRWFMSR